MDKRIHDVFNQIHAEETLKQKTASFLFDEMQKRKEAGKANRLRYAFVLATFAFIILVSSLSYNLYITPSAYIDIDINPSVELTLNRFNRVIAVSPYNDDGEGVLKMTSVRNATYTEAINEILNLMAIQGYLEQDGLLSLTVQATTTNSENEILDELVTKVNYVLQIYNSNATTEIFPVSEEVKNYAHEHHISPAKYLAITELQQVDPTASFSSCADHSISELRNLAQEHGGNHHAENPAKENNMAQDNSSNDREVGENNNRHYRSHH